MSAERIEWGVEQTTLKDGGREVFTVPDREFGERRVAHGFAEPTLMWRRCTVGPWQTGEPAADQGDALTAKMLALADQLDAEALESDGGHTDGLRHAARAIRAALAQ